jgi:hypothetical protein
VGSWVDCWTKYILCSARSDALRRGIYTLKKPAPPNGIILATVDESLMTV